MNGKAIDIWRGAARLWIVAIGIIEVIAVVIYLRPPSPTRGGAVRPLPIIGQGDSALETLAQISLMCLAIAFAGYIGWRAIRWIAKGFQPNA